MRGLSVFNENGVNLSSEQYISQKNNIRVYPNPVQDFAYVQNKTNSKILSIHLLNSKGQLVRSFDTKGEFLNLADIPTGFYILKIRTERGFEMKKIVIVE